MTVQSAADLFQRHRDELGFVNRAQVEEKELFTVERDGDVVAAALANHCVRKPQTTLYELAVDRDHRRRGFASDLIDRLLRDSPHNRVVAKCPADIPANEFYSSTGWDRVDTESGKSRRLNVWQIERDAIDIITTGRPDLTAFAQKYGWLTGARVDKLGEYENVGRSVEFVDIHWEDPDRDALLSAVMRHEPEYVVAGDYDGENYESVNQFGDRLRRWADNVIIVPHEPGEVEYVPDWAVVGYSTPTGYNGTDAPVWEYYGRDVHVLGGTMNQIELVAASLRDDIVSIDTNTMHRDATQYGEYWTPTKPQRKKPPTVVPMIERAYENSVVNMTYALESWGMI